VIWDDAMLAAQFYLDDLDGAVVRGEVSGKVLTLTLNKPATFKKITYLKEMSWKQDEILKGANGLAALTFCNVPIAPPAPVGTPADKARTDSAYPRPGKPEPARDIGP
jgi:hypothetical protein